MAIRKPGASKTGSFIRFSGKDEKTVSSSWKRTRTLILSPCVTILSWSWYVELIQQGRTTETEQKAKWICLTRTTENKGVFHSHALNFFWKQKELLSDILPPRHLWTSWILKVLNFWFRYTLKTFSILRWMFPRVDENSFAVSDLPHPGHCKQWAGFMLKIQADFCLWVFLFKVKIIIHHLEIDLDPCF